MNSKPLLFLAVAFLLLTIAIPMMIVSAMPVGDAAATATIRAQTPTATPDSREETPEPQETDVHRATAAIYPKRTERLGNALQVPAGGTLELMLAYPRCCYVVLPLENVTVEWSVSPDGIASIEPDTGILRVDEDQTEGSVTVTATTNDGLIRTGKVRIYDPEENPLIGIWMEEARLDCDTGEFVEGGIIGEVVFNAYDEIMLTWFPFENMVNYVGEYVIDPETKTILITVDGQHGKRPADFAGNGSYDVDNEGRLILRDISLGLRPDMDQPVACGHRLVRLR